MSPARVLTALAVIPLVAGALALSACGKRATTLERGPPLWGAQAKEEYAAEKAAERERDARKAAARKAAERGETLPPSPETPPSTPKS
jgi:hypothetical protein